VFLPDQLPAEVADLLAQADALPVGGEFNAMDAHTRATWLVGLRQLINRAEAHFIDCLGAFDAHLDGDALHGTASTAAWLRGAMRLAPGDATEKVRIARFSHRQMQGTVAELATGSVNYDHVRAIARSLRHVPEDSQEAAAKLLTDLAKQADVSTVRIAARRLEFVTNPDGTFADAEKQYSRRFLHLSPLLHRMTTIDGLLDPESAAIVSSALGPYLTPTGSEDTRSSSQRRADALVELLSSASATREGTVGGARPQPTLNILCSLESTAPAAGAGTGAETGVILGLPGTGLIAPTAMARISCDSNVARVLLGPERIPTEYGRQKRLFTGGQRHALAIRDGGCRFPDCPRPPLHTDAHHIVAWQNGGPTDLTNAVLLCRYHHRKVHEGGWRIVSRSAEGGNRSLTFAGPDHQELLSSPRAP